MSTSPSLHGIGFDSAYEALDEIFAGHPLKPAVYTAYFAGALFSRISESDELLQVKATHIEKRFRDLHDQKQIFWGMMNEIYDMQVQVYKNWVGNLWGNFKTLLESAAQNSKTGKPEIPQFYEALHNAIIRDYRYFGEIDKAEEFEARGTSGQGDITELVEGELKTLVNDLDPQNIDKTGYNLARRLCVRERPLVLKFLGDQIKGAGWYVKAQGGFDRMKDYFGLYPKYRLFCSKDEWDGIDTILAQNMNGAGEGGKQGQVIGNAFLQSKPGHFLGGGIQKYMEGDKSHENGVLAGIS